MAVIGLSKCLSDYTARFNRMEANVKKEIQNTGTGIVTDAQSNAASIGFIDESGNTVRLAGTISGGVFDNGRGYKIWVDAGVMAAYVEFGTGEYAGTRLAGYPTDWKRLAMTFYKNGKGRLPGRPYLYPAFVKNTVGLVDRLRKALR